MVVVVVLLLIRLVGVMIMMMVEERGQGPIARRRQVWGPVNRVRLIQLEKVVVVVVACD